MLNILLEFFYVIVNGNPAISNQFLKVHNVQSCDFTGTAEADVVLLKERDRKFSPKIGFGERGTVGKVDRDLRRFSSWKFNLSISHLRSRLREMRSRICPKSLIR